MKLNRITDEKYITTRMKKLKNKEKRETIAFIFYALPDFHEKIDDICGKLMTTKSNFIRQAMITKYHKEMKKLKKQQDY